MNDSTPIRVMLVDDHAVVRSGLSAFLMVYDGLALAPEAVQALIQATREPGQRPDQPRARGAGVDGRRVEQPLGCLASPYSCASWLD
ncbi:MAG TPA: response regulator transcription factor [Chloroflexi bacterium]|nr:response regulator transcription factor [Chloroflexota bacterium]